jgi:hypothetical protein
VVKKNGLMKRSVVPFNSSKACTSEKFTLMIQVTEFNIGLGFDVLMAVSTKISGLSGLYFYQTTRRYNPKTALFMIKNSYLTSEYMLC